MIPCEGDAALWFSDDPAEREYAAMLCLDCPFAVDCRDKARQRGEEHGVWGMETPEERQDWLKASGRKPGVAQSFTDQDVYILRLKAGLRAGKTQQEIADSFGVTARTIQRKIEQLQDLLPVKPCDICGRPLPTKYRTITKLCDSCVVNYYTLNTDRRNRLS